MAILAVNFEANVPPTLDSVDAVKAHLAPVFGSLTRMSIESMEYDYVGNYGQTRREAIGLTVKGLAWFGKEDPS